MNNQITTIASLPSGSGQAANLPAEVGEKPGRTEAVHEGDTITYYVDGEVVMVATLGAACREECPQ